MVSYWLFWQNKISDTKKKKKKVIWLIFKYKFIRATCYKIVKKRDVKNEKEIINEVFGWTVSIAFYQRLIYENIS